MSYIDRVRADLDRALDHEDRGGLTLKFPTPQERDRWRLTAYRAIQIDRKQSFELYQPGDGAYGHSRWDFLDIAPVDKRTLYIGPHTRNYVLEKSDGTPLAPSVSRTDIP